MAAAIKKKITTPCRPPNSPPITINSPVINPSSSVVLKKLISLFSPARAFRMLSGDPRPYSLLSLTLRHKFQQRAGHFAHLDGIYRIAPEIVDRSGPQRLPSRRI